MVQSKPEPHCCLHNPRGNMRCLPRATVCFPVGAGMAHAALAGSGQSCHGGGVSRHRVEGGLLHKQCQLPAVGPGCLAAMTASPAAVLARPGQRHMSQPGVTHSQKPHWVECQDSTDMDIPPPLNSLCVMVCCTKSSSWLPLACKPRCTHRQHG